MMPNCQELSADFKLDIHFKSHRTNCCRTVKKHLVDSDSMPPLQSAYRSGHSTETALIKVISDIIDAADGQQVTLLGLLDMSAAFDTVDHDILLHRLEMSYGVQGQALRWLTFLTGKTQAVSCAGRTSPQCRLSCGAPQGSVLGPLLFVLYTADVIGTAMGRGIRIHVYADDTQIYVSCAASDRQPAAIRMLACVSEIESWMSSNRLKLNASKTEFFWIGTRRQLSKVEEEALMVDGQSITPMVKVRDLGVFIDKELTMEAHVSNTVRGCMYQLRQLRSVKRSLILDSRRALAQHLLLVVSTTATVSYTVSATSIGFERCCETRRWYGEVQPLHPYPPWCPPLAPCTAPNQLQNRHTGSGLYSRHRPGLFQWRLCSGDCSPWTNQPAFSDAWRSCDPSNTNKIGWTEFPYIRTDGVELAPWFAQAFCYKPRTFSERTENIPVQESLRTSLWELLKSELTYLLSHDIPKQTWSHYKALCARRLFVQRPHIVPILVR